MRISGPIQSLVHLSPEHWFPGQLWFPPVPMDLRLQVHCHQRLTILITIVMFCTSILVKR